MHRQSLNGDIAIGNSRAHKRTRGPARYIYVSRPGGKPLNIGMNRAKRIAKSADERDRAMVLKTLGTGLPDLTEHHRQLVASRHRYYHEQHDEFMRSAHSGDEKHG